MKTSCLKWIMVFLVASAIVLAHGSHYLPASGAGTVVLNPPLDMQKISLVRETGKTETFPVPKVYQAVYFGYTNCPDACPLTLWHLTQAYRKLGSPANLALVFVTLDPANDTTKVIQTYLKGFAPVIGYTGTQAQISALADAFQIKYNPAPGGGRLYHTDEIALINDQGQVVKMLFGASRLETTDLVNELKSLLK